MACYHLRESHREQRVSVAEDVGHQDGQGDDDHAADGGLAEQVAVLVAQVADVAAEAQRVVAEQHQARQRDDLREISSIRFTIAFVP